MTTWHQVMILGAIFATANIQSTKKVILRKVKDSVSCPGDFLTLNCSVQSDALEWYCTPDAHRTMDCRANVSMTITCYNQTLTPKSLKCISTNDGTVLTSLVEINISSYNTTWTCMNPVNPSQNESITVGVPEPPAIIPKLSGSKKHADNKLRLATISWQESTNVQYHNQSYNITVEPATQECNASCVTSNHSIDLILVAGTKYNITIITEVCNGKMKNVKSKPLLILLNGSSVPSDDWPDIGIISSVVLVSTFVLLCMLLILGACVYLKRSRKKEETIAHHRGLEHPPPMEAGRSAVYKHKMYFAAFQSYQLCYYDLRHEKWYELEEPMHSCNPGLAIISGCVATIGGKRDDDPTNEVWAWNGSDWEAYQSMDKKRSDPAVVTADEKYVIAFGGNIHTPFAVHWTGDVEIYNVQDNLWNFVCKMPLANLTRIEVTLCNNTVYLFPGQDKEGFKCSLDALKSSRVEWVPINGPPLKFSTPATLCNSVVCFGGADASGCGKSEVWMYQEDANSWESKGHVVGEGRMYCMVEVFDNRCVVVGGITEMTDERDPSKRLSRVDIFS